MADPLSVTASVIFLVSVGVRLSTDLYDVCETVSSAQDDIEDIASDLTSFVVVLDELGKIFAAPERIYSDKLELNLLNIIKKCRHIFRQIDHMIKRTVGATKMKLQSKFAWVFRKTKVQELKASLESLKLTIGLMLQTLKLVKDGQQDNREERQVLGNLLRSQTRSVKALRDIETKQGKKPRANRAPISERPPGLDDDSLPTTAETLSDAIPSLPCQENLSTFSLPDIDKVDSRANLGEQAPQQDSKIDWKQGSIITPSVIERSLEPLYPLWRERALEHVEVLLSQWTQPSPELARPTRDSATNQKYSTISGDAEYLLETKKFEDENVVLGKLESEAKASRAEAEERLQKIENRLKKRENGWLEIDDKALARLMDQTKSLRRALKSSTTALESYASSREQFTDRVEAAMRSFYARRESKQEEEKNNNNNRYFIDSDSDPDFDSNSEPDIEESSMVSSSSTTIVGDSLQSTESSDFSLRSTTSLASDVNITATSSEHIIDPNTPPETARNPTLTCNRKAWKPPQPFLDGYDTFSHVLGTAKHVCLWFNASQDTYNFYLGDTKTSFYTLHLVPEHLRTYDTSRVEWTVIQKPWATAQTVRVMNLVYMEDAAGFVWIRKELNWHQIKQLFDLSCVLLDNAINESARDIIQRRLENAKSSRNH